MHRAYLGDGVYVEIQHGMIRLTTETGAWTDGAEGLQRVVRNEIWLEARVMTALVEYLLTVARQTGQPVETR